ncbi:hypothetical protein GCM10009839_44310 [Catenulispora yoronensis]|uniref:Cystatin domain-containing protein n=1 Tax=Catenulispora yoronensis TaxID=450799 RepID=A0ABP5G543_9ACTN
MSIIRSAGAKLRRTGVVAAGLTAAVLVSGVAPANAVTSQHRAVCGSPGLEILTGMPGSYSCAPVPYGPQVQAAGRALVDWANANLPERSPRRHFRVVSAATQVVAGTNYKLLVFVYGERGQTEALAGTVYRALNGTMTVSDATAVVLKG